MTHSPARLDRPPRRARPRALGVAALAAAAAGGALAAPAALAEPATLAVQNDRLSSGPISDISAEVRRVEESNAKATRFDVLWLLVAHTEPANATDPADPAYDWSRIDAIMRQFEEAEIVPIVTVYSAPPWATVSGDPLPPNTEVNPSRPRPEAFADFLTALATRYSGHYTPAGADEALPELRHFEVWNEPNLGAFFSPQVKNGKRVAIDNYARLVAVAYRSIHKANPNAVVIAGVGGPRSSTGQTGTGALPWMRGVLRSNVPFDAYSQHVYPAAPPLRDTPAIPSWSTVDDLIREIDRVSRHRGKSLYITEAGYTTAKTEFRDVRVSVRQQKNYLSQIMSLPVVRGGRIPVVVWFNLRDNPFWPGGLLQEDFDPKPSYKVFQRIAQRTPLHPELSIFSLTRRQLLINQRISQAAVRRANAVQEKLDEGLSGADIRRGGLGSGAFGPGVRVAGTATGAEPQRFDPRHQVSIPSSRGGNPGDVRLAAGQLLINQRISQAAVRRTNALGERMNGNLTGGDLADDSVGAATLAAGLSIARAVQQGAAPEPSTTDVAGRRGGDRDRVQLTIGQLRINQRISQAAVRRSNALLQQLETGLTDENFAPGSITADDLTPALRR